MLREIYSKWPQDASKQQIELPTSTHMHNAVLLVWGSLRTGTPQSAMNFCYKSVKSEVCMTKSIVQSYFGNIFVAIIWYCIELSVAGIAYLTFRQVWETGSLVPRLFPCHTAGNRKPVRSKGQEGGVQLPYPLDITPPPPPLPIGVSYKYGGGL